MEKEGPLCGNLRPANYLVFDSLWPGSERFDFEDQTRFFKALIASLVVDGFIRQNNVVPLGSAALGPRNYVLNEAATRSP